MKNRLRKLNFLKSFISKRPILILALFLLIMSTFVNLEFKKPDVAKAASYTFNENFTTTTYKDTFFTNAEWDTSLAQARLLENQLGAENVSNIYPAYTNIYQVDTMLDSGDNPYVVWGSDISGVTNIYFSKLVPGVGWTTMNGTLGYENISNYTIMGCFDPVIRVAPGDIPEVVFNCGSYLYFTKWSPAACGGGGCWTKMDGVTPGKDQFGPFGSYPQMVLDSSGLPYIIWASDIQNLNFIKWTVGAAPGVCAGGATACWTNMAGTLPNREIIEATMSISYPQILLEKTAPTPTPHIVYYISNGAAKDIYHYKWTPGSLLCGDPIGCWTNMNEDSLSSDNISGDGKVKNIVATRIGDQFRLDSADNPYVIWEHGLNVSSPEEIYFAKWTNAGPAVCGAGINSCWTKMNGTDLAPDNITNMTAFRTAVTLSLNIDDVDIPYITWSTFFPYELYFKNTGDIYISTWSPGGCSGTGCWTSMAGNKKCFFGLNNGTICTSDLDCTGGGICRGFDNLSNNTSTSDYPVLAFDSFFNPYVTWADGLGLQITKWTVGAAPGVCSGGASSCWTNMASSIEGYENPVGSSNMYGVNQKFLFNSLDQAIIFFIRFYGGGFNQRDVYYTKYLTGYTPLSIVQSTNINTAGVFVGSATITTTQTDNPPNQTIDYYLSNDGGITWETVTLGSEHIFTSHGKDLRWRAILRTDNSALTPILDDLAISYETPRLNCNVVPGGVGIGQTVNINATTTFAPAPGSVTADIYNRGVLINTVTLINIGGFNFSVPLITTNDYSGLNDLVVNAIDPGPPQAYTCNTSFTAAASPTPTAPNTPTDFSCHATSFDAIRWSFIDNAINETGFRLYGPNGLIKDSGPEITTDLSYLDEANLETNTRYIDRYVTTFNGVGESSASNMASCYTLAKTPISPEQLNTTDDSINFAIAPNDGNPPNTEYAIKELTTDKYIDANGLFNDTEIWQTYENWGGANGINVLGYSEAYNPNQVTAQVKMALNLGTNYQFATKARNGDGIETAFSPTLNVSTTGTPTPTGGGGTVNLIATKGVAINLAKNSAAKFFKIAFAQGTNSPENRYIVLLREFSIFLNIILLILVIFFLISIYSSIKYLSRNSASKKSISLIWSILTKDPAYVFSIHAPRDESGTYQTSFEKHKKLHVLSQKTLLRALGIVLLKLIILGVLIYGFFGFNQSSYAQMSEYNQSGQIVNVGDTLNYIIEIRNTGSNNAGDFALNDFLDSDLTYILGSAKATINSISYAVVESLVNQSLVLRLGDIPANSTAIITFDARVRPGSEGNTISNFAEGVSANGGSFTTNTITNYVQPLVKYSCNFANGTCSVNTNGRYASLSSCQSACIVPAENINVAPKYSCDTQTRACAIDINGQYNTMTDCQLICAAVPLNINVPPTEQRYSCDIHRGACVVSADGSFTNLSDCQKFCILIPPQPPILPPIISSITSSEVNKVVTNYITPALLTVAAINTIPTAIILISYLLPYLHLLFIEPLLWLFRRKRKKWGIVYNALSKVPVDLAVVRLFRKSDKKLVQTRVTDRAGRYILIVKEKGEYYLSVSKPGFTFPTRYLSDDKQDSKYIDLYHGEAIEVTEKDATITANIPLDPAEKKFMPERAVIFGYLFKNLRLITAYVGMILAVLIFLIYPSLITGLAIFVHLFLLAIFLRLIVPAKPKSWGIIYDQKSKKPLHYAVVRIFDLKFNKLLETQVTDGKGRYSFLVGQNQYQLLAEKVGYQKKEIKPVDLVEKEEIVDLDLGLAKS